MILLKLSSQTLAFKMSNKLCLKCICYVSICVALIVKNVCNIVQAGPDEAFFHYVVCRMPLKVQSMFKHYDITLLYKHSDYNKVFFQ